MTETSLKFIGPAGAHLMVDGVPVVWVDIHHSRGAAVRWLCREHGAAAAPTCEHAAHAAATLARELLGINAEVINLPDATAPGDTQDGRNEA